MATGSEKQGPKLSLAAIGAVSVSVPGLAWAEPMGMMPPVGVITLKAVAVVLAVAVAFGLLLGTAHRLRWISNERRARLSRLIRVGFGGAFLLAAITPYVALHFSMMTVVPFTVTAGFLVALWVWSQSCHEPKTRADSI